MTFFYFLFLFTLLLLCPIVCLVVLVQEAKSLGLGASFGGDAGDSLFGTSTPEILKKATMVLGMVFLVLCMILSFWTSSLSRVQYKQVEASVKTMQTTTLPNSLPIEKS